MNLLTISNVSHRYHTHPVLENISLSIDSGESLALLGRSGCGKSTLARLLVGLERPVGGDIIWQGTSLARMSGAMKKDFRRDIQLVFQDAISAANPRKTVREILAEPLRHLFTLSKTEQCARIEQLMRDVELESRLLDQRPPQLSGGQLQRVCLARALATRPTLLILDEAVSSLDLVLQAGIIRLLKKLQQHSGIACLFITHDLRLVERFCQRVVVMENGHITEDIAVTHPLRFTSLAGQALQQAVLPAFPKPRISGALPCNV
ncbi:nickel import ATP-binding protein NikE [Citrobacter sp. MNAZ 1397]|uniref:nickel import ATP-binding protein NikE n=1 Tax=Citrobacter sp. MNAZ 1397 TaxID=2911205 RepID=UPI002025D5D5|nr:nickel import ATP-binding protein NikE [Citrobacter sp. MNAZ 1397]MCL9673264.1 nickel import ATP-binding protein NikE [Citrobacter sp. MNAZ 1397]